MTLYNVWHYLVVNVISNVGRFTGGCSMTRKRDSRQHVHNSNGRASQVVNKDPELQRMHRELVANLLSSRSRLFEKFLERKRNIDVECGYPEKGERTLDLYNKLYLEEAVAARIVESYPLECWQVQPSVYESDRTTVTTPFEKAWKDLNKTLRGKSWFEDEDSSPIWESLLRADILSGIGNWSIIVLGVADSKELWEPLDGVEDPADAQYPYGTSAGIGSDAQYGELGLTGPIYMDTATGAVKTTGPNIPIPGLSTVIPNDGATETGASLDPNATPNDQAGIPQKPLLALKYIKVYDQSLVQIVKYDSNRKSSRYGHPVEYLVTINSPSTSDDASAGIGLTTSTVKVHWTRVIHVAETRRSSDWCAAPRMEQVLNRVLDLRKLYSGSAEMYWLGALPGWAFETHPELGTSVEIDDDDTRQMMEDYRAGLQRYLTLQGMSAKSLAPQVSDPTPQITVQLVAICIKLQIPLRIFMGSERGELASSQDDIAWRRRLKGRMTGYISPRIIAPFVDRLILCGVLPAPQQSYKIYWPDLNSSSALDEAQVALALTQCDAAYVGGNVESILPLMDYLTRTRGFTQSEAQAIVDAATKINEEKEQKEAEQALLEQDQRIEMERKAIDAGVKPDPTQQQQPAKAPKAGKPTSKSQAFTYNREDVEAFCKEVGIEDRNVEAFYAYLNAA